MTRDELVADGLVTVREAAKFLSVSRTTIYELMDDGELPFSKIRGSRRIPIAALRALAAKNLKGVDPPTTVNT